MAEQRPEQPTPKIDTEGYVDRGAGAFEKTNRPLGRFGSFLRRHPFAQQVAAVGAFVGLGGIAASEVAGCGPATETGKPIITTPNVTMVPTTTETGATTEGSQTTATKEKVLFSDLVQETEIVKSELPQELQAEIDKNQIDTIENIKLFEAQDVNLEKKVSFYFIDTKKNHYVAFEKSGSYYVSDYTINIEFNKEPLGTSLVYTNNEAKDFIKMFLGKDFEPQDGETQKQYLDRVPPLVDGKLYSEDSVKYYLESSKRVELLNPYLSEQVYYTDEQQEAIDKIFKLLQPEKMFIDSKNSGIGENLTENSTLSFLEGLTGQMSMEEIVKKSKLTMATTISSPENVSNETQKIFEKLNPGERILYEGTKNDPTKMNAVLRSNPRIIDIYPDIKFYIDGFGFFPQEGTKDVPLNIVGEFVEAVPIQGSKDFYMVFKNPKDNTEMVLRTYINPNDGNTTSFSASNIMIPIEKDTGVGRGIKYRVFYQMDKGYKLQEWINPGDFAMVFIRRSAKDNKTPIKDENGTYEILNITTFRSSQEQIDNLVKTLK